MVNAPDRIHIAPQGYETERIYQPIIDQRADLVYLLTQPEESETGEECREEVIEQLESEDINVELVKCELFDFGAAFRAISKLIQDHPEDYVAVNISSGSKITAISGTFACMLNDGEPYYVKVNDYGDEPISGDVEGLVDIPTYPISHPDTDLVRILEFVAQQNDDDKEPIFREVIEFAQKEELSVIEESESESKPYHLIKPNVIRPLSRQGYLEVVPYGGEKRLRVTEKGRRTIELAADSFD